MAAERTQEMGVRMTLGARPGSIVAEFLRYGLLSGMMGIAIGLVASVYAQRWLVELLYDIKPFDFPTFSLAAVAVILILTLAIYWPARRASRVDLQSVLRNE